MLFVNRCSWCHILIEVAQVIGVSRDELLSPEELTVIDGRASPEGIVYEKMRTVEGIEDS